MREDLRRRGYGRAVMVAAEEECRRRGVVGVRLNVFGFNRGAQALYEQTGFEVTNVLMSNAWTARPAELFAPRARAGATGGNVGRSPGR